MFGLGIPELLVIFVIALVVFGPKRLPDLGRSIGRAMAEFKKASQEFQDSMQNEMKEVEKAAQVDELKKIGQDAAQAVQEPLTEPKKETGPDAEKKAGENTHGNA